MLRSFKRVLDLFTEVTKNFFLKVFHKIVLAIGFFTSPEIHEWKKYEEEEDIKVIGWGRKNFATTYKARLTQA